MATLGKYAIEPLETGFPKIRNRGLFGCCCKHVLRVLKELLTNRVVLVLCQELKKERSRPGFSSSRRGKVFSNTDLRLTQARRLSGSAVKAFKKYQEEAEKLTKELVPRKAGSGSDPKKTARVKVDPNVLIALRGILPVIRKMPNGEEPFLAGFAKEHKMTRADLDSIIRENNL